MWRGTLLVPDIIADFGNEIFTINLLDEKKKQKGKLLISKFDVTAHLTFMDLYMK